MTAVRAARGRPDAFVRDRPSVPLARVRPGSATARTDETESASESFAVNVRAGGREVRAPFLSSAFGNNERTGSLVSTRQNLDGMQSDPSQSAGVKATDTMFAVLETLRERDGAGVTELADALGLSKSTVHSHLTTLRRNRCVVKDGDTYRVGLRFLSFGGYARTQLGLYDIVKPEVDGLVSETGESAQMVVEEHGRGIYLYQARGERAVRTDSHTGTEVYLHCTAVGKALLAHMDESDVRAVIDRHGLPARTGETTTDPDELFAELAAVCERGYAVDDGERIDGIRCVGVPITTDGGDVIGGLSLTGPTRRMKGERLHETIPDLLTRVARVVEINVTYA